MDFYNYYRIIAQLSIIFSKEKAFADVGKGRRRRHAGLARQRHKGAGARWTRSTAAWRHRGPGPREWSTGGERSGKGRARRPARQGGGTRADSRRRWQHDAAPDTGGRRKKGGRRPHRAPGGEGRRARRRAPRDDCEMALPRRLHGREMADGGRDDLGGRWND